MMFKETGSNVYYVFQVRWIYTIDFHAQSQVREVNH